LTSILKANSFHPNTIERTFDRESMTPLESARGGLPYHDRKRLEVLAAAARVFREVGYDRASMRRIAAEARTSLAGIYHYIDSKEELLLSIRRHTLESLLRGLESGLEGIDDPRERLAAAARNHVRHLGGSAAGLPVCTRELVTCEGEDRDTDRDGVRGLRRSYFDAVHALVRALRPEHDPASRSRRATASLFGMLEGLHRWCEAEGIEPPPDDLAAEEAALFLDGRFGTASHDDRGGNA
jgi:AcrR family transcriptional regulator